MGRTGKISLAIAVIFLLLLGATAAATNAPFSPVSVDELPQQLQESMKAPVFDINEHRYEYQVRVYIAETVSKRWDDDDGFPYEHAFLGFAFNDNVTLTYSDTFSTTVGWSGAQHGYSNITEDSIEVFAAVFDSEYYWAYAYPQQSSNLFQVHEVQASAHALAGETGTDDHSGGYSHTVFIEEGTATW